MKTFIKRSLIVTLVVASCVGLYYLAGEVNWRWRISGNWFGHGSTSFAKLSWNGQCSFQVSDYKGSGKGVFHSKGKYFQIKFTHNGKLHAMTLSQLAYPDYKRIPDGTVSAEILEVEPWFYPTVDQEWLFRTSEPDAPAATPPSPLYQKYIPQQAMKPREQAAPSDGEKPPN